MIKKIYLDMDGVVADFSKRYHEIFNQSPTDSRNQKEFHPHWKQFVLTEQFKNLDWWPDGQEFLEFIATLDIEVEMLSSSGGAKYHDEVTSQKIYWLEEKQIPYKPNIVAGRRKKAEYANPETILVDDTEDVIQSFNEAGGIGILHKNAKDTIETIKTLLMANK